jgi:hypothetical protein
MESASRFNVLSGRRSISLNSALSDNPVLPSQREDVHASGPTETHPSQRAEPSSSPLKAPVVRGTRMRRLVYFFSATSRR